MSWVLTMRQEVSGSGLNWFTNYAFPTRGDARVRAFEIANLFFSLFSVTNRFLPPLEGTPGKTSTRL
jgi:hypothetical protein